MEPFNASLFRRWFSAAPIRSYLSGGRVNDGVEGDPWQGFDPSRDGSEPPSDAERTLVGRLKAGDVEALKALFERHYSELVLYAHRYVQRHAAAEELVQGALTRVWASRERFPTELKPSTYLFVSVRQAAINVVRREIFSAQQRKENVRRYTETVEQNSSYEKLETHDNVAQLDRAIEHLPDRLRTVVELRWRRQLSIADTAKILEITPKAVETYVAKAVNALRLNFQPNNSSHEDAI